jgi:regulation of enolase protein 1 (concanavalin A-like superfamily)
MSSMMFVILEWLNMEFKNYTPTVCDLQTESKTDNFWNNAFYMPFSVVLIF